MVARFCTGKQIFQFANHIFLGRLRVEQDFYVASGKIKIIFQQTCPRIRIIDASVEIVSLIRVIIDSDA